jgi:hypothetical protein
VVLLVDLNRLVEFHDLPPVLVVGGSKPMVTLRAECKIFFSTVQESGLALEFKDWQEITTSHGPE